MSAGFGSGEGGSEPDESDSDLLEPPADEPQPSVAEPPQHPTADADLREAEPDPPLEPDAEAEPGGPRPESDAEAEAEAQPAGSGPVIDALTRIEETLAESQRLIDRQTEVAARLHAENQTLRAGELRTAQTGLVSSVLRVYDDVSRMALAGEDQAAQRDLGIVAEALADALERNGVERMPVGPEERFEPGRHKVVEVEATPDAEADRTIARVVRPGFVWPDGSVVRVSDVAVRKHEATPDGARRDPVAD